jgi:GT2 family glycosyltransferase
MRLALYGNRANDSTRQSLSALTASRAPQRLPLSALRARLDEGSAEASWSPNRDGVIGRALMMPAGAVFTVPLRLANEITFSARAMLLPHDWRDGRGAVHASVAVTDKAGNRCEISATRLRASDRGRPRGGRIECQLPSSTTSVQLRVEAFGRLRPRSVTRAIWLEPVIIDPHASPLPEAPPAAAYEAEATSRQSKRPLISVLTPVHDPPLHILDEAIASVRQQTLADWELCLVDDGSGDPEIIGALERYAAADPRIHLKRRETAGGIATATNAAMELATGEYIALLDHDDMLAPDALQHVADQITSRPELDMIYSDEDIVLDGRPIWRHFKPDWSPDTLRVNGYTCHLGVYRRSLVGEIGGFRSEFNGSQDVDMILRLVEHTDRIAHIPRILYHWRAHAASTAGGDSKPYAYVAARNAIAEHLDRVGLPAEVGYGPPGLYRVAHRVARATSVDLVLAVTDDRGLERAAASWLAQPHPTWNVVLAAPAEALDAATTALTTAGVPDSSITPIASTPGHDLATTLATAAEDTAAEHLLLMQTPATGLTHDWLTRLIGYSNQPEIAAAGPILLGPDGRISEAGIALPEGIPLHLLHGARSSMDDFFGFGTSVYNVSAVSGVLATRRETYEQLGGLDPGFKELALIDYCLRATNAGGRVVIVPDARLRTTGPDTTTNDLPAIWRLRQRWAQTHTRDPYYNPNYRTDRGDFEPIRA